MALKVFWYGYGGSSWMAEKLRYIIEDKLGMKLITIHEGFEDIKGLEFREIPNPEGDIGDNVTIILESREKATKFVKLWTKKGYFTKNLPDAIDWHFAGTWNHIFNRYDEFKGKDLLKIWKKSDDILRRSCALPVFINMDGSDIDNIVKSVKEIIKKV